MTRAEIDILWQRAMAQSIKDGEMFTRYHFAKLVADAERERIETSRPPGCRVAIERARQDERDACYQRRGVWMFNPYTGVPRHPSDVASDPHGILLLDPEQAIRAKGDA